MEGRVSSGLPQGQGYGRSYLVTQLVAETLLEEVAINPPIELLSR